eukprot:2037962-Prymnesium_polylepis.1
MCIRDSPKLSWHHVRCAQRRLWCTIDHTSCQACGTTLTASRVVRRSSTSTTTSTPLSSRREHADWCVCCGLTVELLSW